MSARRTPPAAPPHPPPPGPLALLLGRAALALHSAASLRGSRRSRARALVADAYAEIRHADQKAAILLAASGVVVGALLGAALAGEWSPGDLRAPWDRVFWGGCLAFGAATAALAWAVYPRLPTAPRRSAPTAVSFLDVERIGTDTELSTALDPDLAALLGHLRTVSRIVHRKYRLLRAGIGLMVAAFGLFTAAAVGAAVA
ncbi:Pycsar system effector family protein [Nocardiopsis suaedae]|uniref:DUF5706 domain-containing protein n=1 Tax=Nocardiopsis suaedae TaxID=3018444 RepID=A0ABT4TPP6_9ACTN|nr:Pycsar system effector family protein [Nocardiopsis suaedae]MDA2806360.1 DUF5706 domain-containing protein [Nocardiopsis suaedae]